MADWSDEFVVQSTPTATITPETSGENWADSFVVGSQPDQPPLDAEAIRFNAGRQVYDTFGGAMGGTPPSRQPEPPQTYNEEADRYGVKSSTMDVMAKEHPELVQSDQQRQQTGKHLTPDYARIITTPPDQLNDEENWIRGMAKSNAKEKTGQYAENFKYVQKLWEQTHPGEPWTAERASTYHKINKIYEDANDQTFLGIPDYTDIAQKYHDRPKHDQDALVEATRDLAKRKYEPQQSTNPEADKTFNRQLTQPSKIARGVGEAISSQAEYWLRTIVGEDTKTADLTGRMRAAQSEAAPIIDAKAPWYDPGNIAVKTGQLAVQVRTMQSQGMVPTFGPELYHGAKDEARARGASDSQATVQALVTTIPTMIAYGAGLKYLIPPKVVEALGGPEGIKEGIGTILGKHALHTVGAVTTMAGAEGWKEFVQESGEWARGQAGPDAGKIFEKVVETAKDSALLLTVAGLPGLMENINTNKGKVSREVAKKLGIEETTETGRKRRYEELMTGFFGPKSGQPTGDQPMPTGPKSFEDIRNQEAADVSAEYAQGKPQPPTQGEGNGEAIQTQGQTQSEAQGRQVLNEQPGTSGIAGVAPEVLPPSPPQGDQNASEIQVPTPSGGDSGTPPREVVQQEPRPAENVQGQAGRVLGYQGEGTAGPQGQEEAVAAPSADSGQQDLFGGSEPDRATSFGAVIPNPLAAVMPDTGSGFLKNAWSQIKGIFGNSVAPKTSKLAPKSVVAMQAHAGAHGAGEPVVEDMLQKVFGDKRKDENTLSKFSEIQNADNILSIYNDALAKARNLQGENDVDARNEALKVAGDIADKHDQEELKDIVMTGLMNPEMKQYFENWKKVVVPEWDKIYNQLKRLDPDTPQTGRGFYTGARMNLVTKERAEAWGSKSQTSGNELPDQSIQGNPTAGSVASYRNPDVKRDPFMRTAKGTGDYSTDLRANMLSVYSPRWNQATKIAMYDSLVDEGAAKWEPAKDTPESKSFVPPKGYKRMPVDIPVTDPDTGRTKINERGAIWVHPDIWEEVRNALGTDMRTKPFWWAQGLTALQIASQMDAVSHGLTVERTVANALGSTSIGRDLLRKIPGLDIADSIATIAKAANDVFKEAPETLERKAGLAKKGLLRPQFETGGFGSKVAIGAKFLHAIDTAGRIVLDRYYDKIMETYGAKEEGRGRFLEAFGNYNRRMMKTWERNLRDFGFSPFLAGGKMAMGLGKRMLTGDPGFQSASWKAASAARLMQLSKPIIAVGIMAPAINFLLHGQFGGRQGTPPGAIDLGDDDDGKRKVFDLLQMIGWKRGARLLGIPSIVQGVQQGKNFNQIAHAAAAEASQTWLHPLIGPALSAAAGMGGKQLSLRGNIQAERIPEGGFAQDVENTRATLEAQNPLLYYTAKQFVESLANKGGKKLDQSDWLDIPKKGLLRQASSSFGITTIAKPSDVAESLARTFAQGKLAEGMTEKEQQQTESKHHLLDALRKDYDKGTDALQEEIDAGKITKQIGKNLLKRSQMSDLQWYSGMIEADDLRKVWDNSTPAEKEELKPIIAKKWQRADGKSKEILAAMFNEGEESTEDEKEPE